MESGWNVWVWLVGVVSRRWVWLVGVGGIYGCGWVWVESMGVASGCGCKTFRPDELHQMKILGLKCLDLRVF